MILKDLRHTIELLSAVDENALVYISFGEYTMDNPQIESVQISIDNENETVDIGIQGKTYNPNLSPEVIDVIPGTLKDVERASLVSALEKYNNNRDKAAEYLGISRRTIYRKIKQFGLC